MGGGKVADNDWEVLGEDWERQLWSDLSWKM